MNEYEKAFHDFLAEFKPALVGFKGVSKFLRRRNDCLLVAKFDKSVNTADSALEKALLRFKELKERDANIKQ